jgi:hypothetical protein
MDRLVNDPTYAIRLLIVMLGLVFLIPSMLGIGIFVGDLVYPPLRDETKTDWQWQVMQVETIVIKVIGITAVFAVGMLLIVSVARTGKGFAWLPSAIGILFFLASMILLFLLTFIWKKEDPDSLKLFLQLVTIAIIFQFSGWIFARDDRKLSVYVLFAFLPVIFFQSLQWLSFLAGSTLIVADWTILRGALLLFLTIFGPALIGILALIRLPELER